MPRSSTWRVGRVAGLLCVLAGCGGGLAGPDGAAGSGGATGTGGSGASSNPNGLPACAIGSTPPDAGPGPTTSGCNTILIGTFVANECFTMVDGGLVGGPAPVGGKILDGDYNLVRYQNSVPNADGSCTPSTATTNRTVRIYNGGTYFEWFALNRDSAQNEMTFSYDTTMSAAGHVLTFVSWDCGTSFSEQTYGYTANVDDFVYFRYTGGVDTGGDLTTVATYRRSCWR
ncbi:MAG TPA: hypothetical protein VKQ32_19520 [Polyangia bacterium]|nr:hypothetical protein [Polyangia bacterium]